jgi:hypothetical protein
MSSTQKKFGNTQYMFQLALEFHWRTFFIVTEPGQAMMHKKTPLEALEIT